MLGMYTLLWVLQLLKFLCGNGKDITGRVHLYFTNICLKIIKHLGWIIKFWLVFYFFAIFQVLFSSYLLNTEIILRKITASLKNNNIKSLFPQQYDMINISDKYNVVIRSKIFKNPIIKYQMTAKVVSKVNFNELFMWKSFRKLTLS